MSSDGQKRPDVPIPEPAPPAFHKPPMRKREKPWRVEIRSTREVVVGWLSFPDWTPLTRYHRQRDAEQAVRTLNRNSDIHEYRVVGPDESLDRTDTPSE
jgi:hypothetical protein